MEDLGHNQDFTEEPDLIYKSKLPERAIRLLRLLPGNQEDEIECELVEASLDELPHYEAISYVWGPPQEREAITCEGHRACA
jgi:hypothetical protein